MMVSKIKEATIYQTADQILEYEIASNLANQGDLEDIGTLFGIFESMSQFGPISTAELAKHTGISELAAVAWLGAQLAADAIAYDVNTGLYSLWSNWQ